MSYIGNTPTNQNFVAGADQFNGTGSQTVFTLSRNVNTVFDIFVAISNVPQDPYNAYSVSGNTLTFTSAPPSGTGNIYVVYRATNVQTFVPTPGVSAQFGLGSAAAPSMTFIGNTTTGVFSPATNTLAFSTNGTEDARFDSSGNFGIGTSSPESFGGGHKTLELAGSTNTEGGVFKTSTSGSAGSGSTGVEMLVYTNSVGGYNNVTSAHPLVLSTANTERMRIDTSGNVGIGTSSPAASLSIERQTTALSGTTNAYGLYAYPTASGKSLIESVTSGAGATSLGFRVYDNGVYNELQITQTGRFDLSNSNTLGVYLRSAGTVTLAANATLTLCSATAGGLVVSVYVAGSGNGGLFWVNYSSVVTKVAGDGAATDTGTDFAVYKNAASHTATLRNRAVSSQTFYIAILSADGRI